MENLTIVKQPDGGYIVRYEKYPDSGGIYSGGLDGAIKFICNWYKYPIEYLIEDLNDDIPK